MVRVWAKCGRVSIDGPYIWYQDCALGDEIATVPAVLNAVSFENKELDTLEEQSER
jgi:hypothetical protein